MASIESEYDVCPVCAENRRKRNWITCFKCSFSCCRICIKTFLLDDSDINPKCMSCKVQWDFEFIARYTDSNFHNKDYRNHRAKILVDREKSLLPATQPYVEQFLQIKQLEEELVQKEKEIKKIKKMLELAKEQKNDMIRRLQGLQGNGELTIERQNSRFVGHCPQKECKGYLDTKYVCGLCNEKACRSCRLPKHDGDCDKDVVETVKLLAKDTKSCPNCGVPISKISGCDQIWCVSCHTPFSWTTGKIETGKIHNPHYYEWQRKNGGVQRDPGDQLCGGQVSFYKFRQVLSRYGKDKSIEESHRISAHIRNVVIVEYNEHVVNEETNRDLRIKYMINEMDEKKWIREIKKREKKREKNRTISAALMMFVDTIDDLHANIVQSKEEKEVDGFIEQIKQLRIYTDSILKQISKRFENQVPSIGSDWKMYTIKP